MSTDSSSDLLAKSRVEMTELENQADYSGVGHFYRCRLQLWGIYLVSVRVVDACPSCAV